ncbi:MAG: lipoyl protein ligase domain-containing protein [Chloroflexota bacterium]
MEYYFLDRVPWQDSQSLYHAAAYLGREVLFILRPATPYFCLGCHQDARQEVDLEYVGRHEIPLLRREVGGGAVYLDGQQLFYQFVLRKDRPGLPAAMGDLYRTVLQPVVETYRQFGVAAEFRPVNDIIANGRKVSGNGAAEINDMRIVVGNFILDFDYEMMSRVLRVPDEKFRDKVYKTLSENLSTFRREIGSIPETADLAADLRRRVEALLGPLEQKYVLDEALRRKANERFDEMYSDAWLFDNDFRKERQPQVKIREGVSVLQKVVKLPGGLVRLTAINQEGRLADVHLSGDFFIYPQSSLAGLEQALEGVALEGGALEAAIAGFYARGRIETPGITPQALAGVFLA